MSSLWNPWFGQWNQANHRMNLEWTKNNASFTLELLKSGELTDFIIEVHQQQQHTYNDDANDGNCLQKGSSSSSKIDGHANTAAAVQKAEFNVHKFILCAHSEVFRAMISHKDTKECRESRITITDSTIAAVRQMINYIYTGMFPNPNDCDYSDNMVVHPLMDIAHKYQIKPMVECIVSILVDKLSFENVFDRLELADVYGTEKLKSAASRMITENMEKFEQKAEWVEMQKNMPELALYVQKVRREYEERLELEKKAKEPTEWELDVGPWSEWGE